MWTESVSKSLTYSGADEYDITFYVPCLNEEDNIVPTIETILSALKEVGVSGEILIYDDNSIDNTVGVVEEYQQKHPGLPIKLIKNNATKGLAYNYIEGAFLGRGKYYSAVGGDNDVPKEWILSILKNINSVDVIILYFEQDTRHRIRVIISRIFTCLMNLLSGHSLKYYNGAVHLRSNVLRWHSDASGFGFMAELTVRVLNQGASYIEIAAPMYKKKQQVFSKAFTLHSILSVSHTLFKILILRIRKILFNI